ncbi:hypothetical protein [Mucilaginibacter lacusdianchii]|uniref:hypothetical protein n=1 Tax=Mucilaginibacter lacusdianchii TaxID=2684211 RepID=UPI00131C2568|nr:hypothetical protein [Mucilaginibacter sp. JXJ CY 39]
MRFFQLLLRLFGFKPRWNGTPEMFLAMVLEMQSRNNKEFSVQEVLQWGEVMQKVIQVDLKPYRSFADLVQHGQPDFSLVEKVRGKMDELKHRQELRQAIYGKQADLGDDDVMKSDAESAVFARRMVKDLSRYVQFPDSEHNQISKL